MTDTKTIAYEPVIGLEIHVQLDTKSKLFCSCPSGTQDRPNTAICPICTGQPGVLPVLNRAAVESAMKAAMSLNCRLNPRSVFARKNYFYPDCPKDYQISQYELPLAEHGSVTVELDGENGIEEHKIGITRVHMEEDAGKLMHEEDGSLVDFNRSGVALVEIVSEPDMRSPMEAYEYLTTLKNTLQWAGVSSCDMEKGELRVDVNLSLRPKGAEKFGTKVEIKNLNSFKAVKDSLTYEIGRQAAALDAGETIHQETRLWDDKAGSTTVMRSKEKAHDYRYFPEPDLVPLAPSQEWRKAVADALPELPSARKKRFIKDYQLSAYDAGVMTSQKSVADYFETAMKHAAGSAKTVVNLISNDIMARLNAEKKDISAAPVLPANLGKLVVLMGKGTVSSKMAKDIVDAMWKTGKSAEEIVASSGMAQVNDEAQIAAWAREAIAANPKAAADLRAGNDKAAGPLVGFVMKKSRGKANPALLNGIIKKVAME